MWNIVVYLMDSNLVELNLGQLTKIASKMSRKWNNSQRQTLVMWIRSIIIQKFKIAN